MSQKKRLKCWVERENKRRHQSGKGAGLSLSTNSRTKHIFLEFIMVAGSSIYVSCSGSFFSFYFFSSLVRFLLDASASQSYRQDRTQREAKKEEAYP